MHTIVVCIGSGCHLKGSYQIIEILQRLIAQYQLDVEVSLEASFCQGHCTEGVVVKIDDQLITGVSPENVTDLFEERLLGGNQHCTRS